LTPALIRRLRRDAPCLRAYGRSLGVGLEDLAVDDVFIRVVPPVIPAPAFVAFLEAANGDGSPRFGAGTRRVYRSHASRLARQVVRARRAVLGESDELWTELLEVLGSTDDPPLYRDRAHYDRLRQHGHGHARALREVIDRGVGKQIGGGAGAS
jgi:hypothetical protein